MTDTSINPRPFKTGRKPQRPVGQRLPIKWLHEYDSSVAPGAPVSYPVDVSQGKTEWLILGNGPDPTLTITTPNGVGQPVGDCGFAGKDHDKMLAGYVPTANGTVAQYDIYDGGVDEGVVIADMLLWLMTHDEAGNVVPATQGDVELFAPVHPSTLGAIMTKYQRGIILGVNLTPCDQQDFPVWTVNATCQPDTSDGHVVYLVKLAGPIGSPTGSGGPVSWGQVVDADAAWMSSCPEEYWILLTSQDREKMGAAAYDALAADLAALPSETGSAPTPAPIPVVTPPVVTPPVVTPPVVKPPVVTPPAPNPVPKPEPVPVPATLTAIVGELVQMLEEWISTLKSRFGL
jgi:hypothetical protein